MWLVVWVSLKNIYESLSLSLSLHLSIAIGMWKSVGMIVSNIWWLFDISDDNLGINIWLFRISWDDSQVQVPLSCFQRKVTIRRSWDNISFAPKISFAGIIFWNCDMIIGCQYSCEKRKWPFTHISLSLFFYALWPHKTSWSMQVWGSLAAFVEAANLARGFRLVFYWFSTQQVLPSWFMLVKWEKISKWIPNRHFHVYVHFQYLDINSQTLKNNNRR